MDPDLDLEGLVHESELTWLNQRLPEQAIKTGQVIDVKVIRVDVENRKIGLSLKGVTEEERAQLVALHGEAPRSDAQTERESGPDTISGEIPAREEIPMEHPSGDTLGTEEAISDSEGTASDDDEGYW
jgi:transcriptional accessory protein Tex/SPT6